MTDTQRVTTKSPPRRHNSLVFNDLRQPFLFNCFFLSVWLVVGGGIGWRTIFLPSSELAGSFIFFFFITKDLPFSFYPDLSTTRQWIIWWVYYLTRRIDYNRVAVIVCFISFHCDDRFSLPCLGITADLMLIDVYSFFHKFNWTLTGVQWRRPTEQSNPLRRVASSPCTLFLPESYSSLWNFFLKHFVVLLFPAFTLQPPLG